MNVGSALILSFLEVLDWVLNLYVWVIVIGAILSWLVAFNIVNSYNRVVQTIGDIVFRLTEPALKPIRRILPMVGGLDLSPLILILIIIFLQSFIHHLMF